MQRRMANLISVAILTRNGGEVFASVLEALEHQEISVPYEIVLLDSQSSDGTVRRARRAGAHIHQIHPEDFSFGESRDELFGYCEGDIIATLSQDARPLTTSWLDALTAPIRSGSADISQGVERLTDKPFFWERVGKFYSTSEWIPFFEEYGYPGLSTVNLAASRQAWKKTGFGPIPMCSDKLFQKRAAQAGLKTTLCDKAVVQHGHEYSTASLVKRCANEGLALRHLGFRVELPTTLRDLGYLNNYRTLLRGLMQGEVNQISEFLFPILRPVAIWYGNHFLADRWR